MGRRRRGRRLVQVADEDPLMFLWFINIAQTVKVVLYNLIGIAGMIVVLLLVCMLIYALIGGLRVIGRWVKSAGVMEVN